MDKLQITEEQEQQLLTSLKKRANLWMVFFVIGIIGFIPIGISFFGDSSPSYFSSPTFVFFILGTVFWSQSESAIKKVKEKDYKVYKAECRKMSVLGSAYVDNNEILSKTVKKAQKGLEVLGSTRSLRAGEEIGILQVDKDFWVFSLNT